MTIHKLPGMPASAVNIIKPLYFATLNQHVGRSNVILPIPLPSFVKTGWMGAFAIAGVANAGISVSTMQRVSTRLSSLLGINLVFRIV